MKKKTTVYLYEDLLRAAKVAAAREDKKDYEVIEEALRRHLGFDLLERVRARAGLDEEQAMALALEETRTVRRKRAKKR
jgi:hypothetical protein